MSATAIWSAFAWSQDSTRIAALCSTSEQIQICSVQGEALESFSTPGVDHKDWSRTPRINWVPGQNKVSYVNKEAFIIIDLADGTRWMSTEIGPQYAWLPDGRLAFAGEYDPNNGQLMYIVEIDWK